MKNFLLIGQSNMAGRGIIEEVPVISNPQIQMYRDNQWQLAVEPLHLDKATAGVGLAMSFAQEFLKKYPAEKVGLIPTAVGGTPLIRWMPSGDLYQNAVAITKNAIGNQSLAGILWHQGEAETDNLENVKVYEKNLTEMLTQIRRDLNSPKAPIILGELGHFLSKNPALPYFTQINQALHQVAQKLSLCSIATAESLNDKGDILHFDSKSLRIFGLRYFEKFINIKMEK